MVPIAELHLINQLSKKEQCQVQLLPIMGGVELLAASYIKQRFSRHFHEGYAVGCIEQGAMAFRYRGENLVAPAGHINLVIPGEVHDGYGVSNEGWSYRMFYLPPEALSLVAKDLSTTTDLPHFRPGVLSDPKLAQLLRSTHSVLFSPVTTLLEKESQLHILLSQWLIRHADGRWSWPKSGQEDKRIELAKEYIQSEYATDISLDQVAAVAGISPFHFLRLFSDQVGIAPHAYLIQARIEQAKQQLSGGARLADVAAECGFSDQAHLTRLYKKQYGITPGRYRNNIQNS